MEEYDYDQKEDIYQKNYKEKKQTNHYNTDITTMIESLDLSEETYHLNTFHAQA